MSDVIERAEAEYHCAIEEGREGSAMQAAIRVVLEDFVQWDEKHGEGHGVIPVRVYALHELDMGLTTPEPAP